VPTTLPIKGTFDIAMARNFLRQTAQGYNWPPQFRARASAALSALAELGLFAQPSNGSGFNLCIDILERGGIHGIECSCEIRRITQTDNFANYARLQLERASDEVEFKQLAEMQQIKARVWLK
jgi:hypothetical protein